MLHVSHVSSISNSEVSLSHREKPTNSLSTEDEDPAPVMGSSATVTACMSQVKKGQSWFVVALQKKIQLIISDGLSSSFVASLLNCFDSPLELLLFLDPPLELLFF